MCPLPKYLGKWIAIILMFAGSVWSSQKECEDLNGGICGTFSDRTTGLTWTGQDSGKSVSWNEAGNYCRALTLGSHSDWRLPIDSELRSIYAPAVKKGYIHIKGGISLSDKYVWSSSGPDSLSGKPMARYFDFETGTEGMAEFEAKSSALCVRRMPQDGSGSCTNEPDWRPTHFYESTLHVKEAHGTFFTATIDRRTPGQVAKTYNLEIESKDCSDTGCSIPKPGDYPVVVTEKPSVQNTCVSSKELPATRTICYGSYTKSTVKPKVGFGCYQVSSE